MEISFKTKEHPEARKVNYDMPEGLEALTSKFGAEAVASAATGAFVISLQALARRHIEKSDEEIQALVNSWNPNERSPAVKQTPFERAAGALAKLSPEEKKELMAKLRAG